MEQQRLAFFDAAAPIVSGESVDTSIAFFASRYGKGDGEDYLNCPMNKEEYEAFYQALVEGERAPLSEEDQKQFAVYEGCMPIEVMARPGQGHHPLRPHETGGAERPPHPATVPGRCCSCAGKTRKGSCTIWWAFKPT